MASLSLDLRLPLNERIVADFVKGISEFKRAKLTNLALKVLDDKDKIVFDACKIGLVSSDELMDELARNNRNLSSVSVPFWTAAVR